MRIAFHNPRVLTLETRIPAMGHVQRTAPGFLAAWAERRLVREVGSGQQHLHLVADRIVRMRSYDPGSSSM